MPAAARETRVSMGLLRDAVHFAAARARRTPPDGRAAVEWLCAAGGFDPALLSDPDAWLPGSACGRVWDAAALLTADPDFGLHLGERAGPAGLGIVGYLMQGSETLGRALSRLLRYGNLLTDGVRLALWAEDADVAHIDLLVVEHRPNFLTDSPRAVIECSAASLAAMGRALVGRPLPLRSVSFRHPRPATGAAEHARVFAPALEMRFGADENRLTLDRAALDWPLPLAQPGLLPLLEAQADALLGPAADAEAGWSERARREIARLLKGETPGVAEVARALGVGTRALQAGLQSEGVTFRALLDETRRDVAVRLLGARESPPVADIALLLGFSEPSAFYRSFRRWTGRTPQSYRPATPPPSPLPAAGRGSR